jgi:hypothetical protein
MRILYADAALFPVRRQENYADIALFPIRRQENYAGIALFPTRRQENEKASVSQSSDGEQQNQLAAFPKGEWPQSISVMFKLFTNSNQWTNFNPC